MVDGLLYNDHKRQLPPPQQRQSYMYAYQQNQNSKSLGTHGTHLTVDLLDTYQIYEVSLFLGREGLSGKRATSGSISHLQILSLKMILPPNICRTYRYSTSQNIIVIQFDLSKKFNDFYEKSHDATGFPIYDFLLVFNCKNIWFNSPPLRDMTSKS